MTYKEFTLNMMIKLKIKKWKKINHAKNKAQEN